MWNRKRRKPTTLTVGEISHGSDNFEGKMGWTGRLATGAVKGGYVHVFTDDAWRLNSGGTK
jgi:hypothetical protein